MLLRSSSMRSTGSSVSSVAVVVLVVVALAVSAAEAVWALSPTAVLRARRYAGVRASFEQSGQGGDRGASAPPPPPSPKAIPTCLRWLGGVRAEDCILAPPFPVSGIATAVLAGTGTDGRFFDATVTSLGGLVEVGRFVPHSLAEEPSLTANCNGTNFVSTIATGDTKWSNSSFASAWNTLDGGRTTLVALGDENLGFNCVERRLYGDACVMALRYLKGKFAPYNIDIPVDEHVCFEA